MNKMKVEFKLHRGKERKAMHTGPCNCWKAMELLRLDIKGECDGIKKGTEIVQLTITDEILNHREEYWMNLDCRTMIELNYLLKKATENQAWIDAARHNPVRVDPYLKNRLRNQHILKIETGESEICKKIIRFEKTFLDEDLLCSDVSAWETFIKK